MNIQEEVIDFIKHQDSLSFYLKEDKPPLASYVGYVVDEDFNIYFRCNPKQKYRDVTKKLTVRILGDNRFTEPIPGKKKLRRKAFPIMDTQAHITGECNEVAERVDLEKYFRLCNIKHNYIAKDKENVEYFLKRWKSIRVYKLKPKLVKYLYKRFFGEEAKVVTL